MPYRLEVSPLSAADLAIYYPQKLDFPILAYAGMMWPTGKSRRKPRLVAVGGLAWRFDRCDIWLHVFEPKLVPPIALVRYARRVMKVAVQMGEQSVYCFRDNEPNSAKLLRLVGMRQVGVEELTFHDGKSGQGELWKWPT